MSVNLEPGREVSIRGERGARFTVLRVNEDRGEVTCYGGRPGHDLTRTFRLNRVTVVHQTVKRKAGGR